MFTELMQPVLSQLEQMFESLLMEATYEANEIDEVLLVGGSSRIKCVRDWLESYFGKAPNLDLNPEEAVATGTALMAGQLTTPRPSLASVTTSESEILFSLGIQIANDRVDRIIEIFSAVPAEITKKFKTHKDDQKKITIKIVKGDREKASENDTLGKFHVKGVPPGPAGSQIYSITFKIDADSNLTVSA